MTSSSSSEMPNEIRYPKLHVAVVVEDSVTGKKCLSSVSLTPEQLEAFRVAAISSATKALILGMVSSPQFMDFMAVIDPLWKNLLFEFPLGQRGSSATVHPLAQKHGDRPMANGNAMAGAVYMKLASRFGRGHMTNEISTAVCAITAYGSKLGSVVTLVDISQFPPKVLEVISEVIPDAVAEEIDCQLWECKLQLPAPGAKFKGDEVQVQAKARAVNKPLPSKAAREVVVAPVQAAPAPVVVPPTMTGGER